MKRFSVYFVMLATGAFLLLLATVVILALIPLYLRGHSGDMKLDDRKQSFQWRFNFMVENTTSMTPRSLSPSPSSSVDVASLPTIERALRDILNGWNMPHFISPHVEEAYIDLESNLLQVGGFYLFLDLCNRRCQQPYMDILNNKDEDLKQPIHLTLLIGGRRYVITLTHLTVLRSTQDLATSISLDIVLTNSSRQSTTKASAIPVNGQNVIDLLKEVLSINKSLPFVSFDILRATKDTTNSTTVLHVEHLLKYSLACFQFCQENTLDEFLTVLIQLTNTSDVTFNDGGNLHMVQQITPLVTSSDVSVPFRTFNFQLNNTMNPSIPVGVIIDQTQLNNITGTLDQGFFNNTDIQLVHGSLEKNDSSSVLPSLQYHLVLIIKFNFASSQCRRGCQKEKIRQETANAPQDSHSVSFHLFNTDYSISSLQITSLDRVPVTTATTTTTTPSTT